jgi:hypothetical protein
MPSLTHYLRTRFNNDEKMAAIDKEIAETDAMADAGARMLRYRDIGRESLDAAGKISNRGMLFGIPGMAGLIMGIVGLCTVSGGLLLAGVALFGGAGYMIRNLGEDAHEAAWKRVHKCVETSDGLAASVAPKDIAASPSLEKVLKTFPDLRERFLAAVMREKFTPPPAPAPSAQPVLKL